MKAKELAGKISKTIGVEQMTWNMRSFDSLECTAEQNTWRLKHTFLKLGQGGYPINYDGRVRAVCFLVG